MGLAIVTGILVPGRFKHKPVHTGEEHQHFRLRKLSFIDNVDINQVLDLILTNQMLIAALTAFVLDSIAPGTVLFLDEIRAFFGCDGSTTRVGLS